jgi:PIN domain nuclease of toxin-antitoxin system
VILLDTHAFLWLASSPGMLSPKSRKEIQANPAALHLSVVSSWEIAILVKRKRLELPMAPAEFIERAIAHLGVIELALSRATILASTSLPDIHNDPFDRVLVAECLQHGLSLVTCDRTIATYPGIRVIW